MNYENKHRIESLAKAACPNNKKVSVIFRSKENKLSDRPNAFIVTVGKKGYTSVRQSNYWAVDTVNSCKDYSDQELAQILLRINGRGLQQLRSSYPRRKNQSQSHCSSKASNEGLGDPKGSTGSQ